VPDWDEEEGGTEAVTRSFWSGTITFGLVSIPVALYAANRSQRVSLRMVTEEGTPLVRRYFTSKNDRELDADEIVRGYEVEKDRFVIADDDELERLAPERTRDIDLRQFVDASEIDPMYFERAYYLTPAGQSTKAYRLLARVMEETGRAGIATFVMRTREYLVAILAENGILRAETLRFADELRKPGDIGLPEAKEPPAAAVKRVDREIGKRLESRLNTKELADDSVERIRKLASGKVRAGEDVFHLDEEDVERPTDIIDLMEILKRRLQGQTEEEDASAGSAAAPRKSAASKKPRATASKSSGASKSKASSAKKSTASSAKKPAKSAGGARKTADLRESSKAELLKRAQKLDIPGRSGMSKDELVKAIRRSA
jgi:DNA end-binding protein Ku